MKITDIFEIGDKVEWETIHQKGRYVEIKLHQGTIDEIQGSEAMIRMRDGRKRRRRVSLFSLKPLTDEWKADDERYNQVVDAMFLETYRPRK